MTVIGAGGTAPNQVLGAEHSQPFHAYIMGIPGLKICTASQTPRGVRAREIYDSRQRPRAFCCSREADENREAVLPWTTSFPCTSYLHATASGVIDAGKAVTVLRTSTARKESEDAMTRLNRGVRRGPRSN